MVKHNSFVALNVDDNLNCFMLQPCYLACGETQSLTDLLLVTVVMISRDNCCLGKGYSKQSISQQLLQSGLHVCVAFPLSQPVMCPPASRGCHVKNGAHTRHSGGTACPHLLVLYVGRRRCALAAGHCNCGGDTVLPSLLLGN